MRECRNVGRGIDRVAEHGSELDGTASRAVAIATRDRGHATSSLFERGREVRSESLLRTAGADEADARAVRTVRSRGHGGAP
jgi:hypothetical protein